VTLLFPLPELGSKWVSKDPRDHGVIATVIAVSDRFIQIKRFNKTMVRTDRFHKAYRPALSMDDGGS
jgi:hypothetical protein